MGIGEYEAQANTIGTGAQPATGYPVQGTVRPADANAPQPAAPSGKAGPDPYAAPYQPHPQAYHEEFVRPPPQYQAYPAQPPPQQVIVQRDQHSANVARGCFWGCLAALCCCCLI